MNSKSVFELVRSESRQDFRWCAWGNKMPKVLTTFATWKLILAVALASALTGCGSSLPDVSAVRKQMTAEQLAVGEPMVGSVGMTLVPIPAGAFLMGTATPTDTKSNDGKKPELPPGAEAEQPQHNVSITKPFFISICEVTQGQYEQVLGEAPWKGQPLTIEGKNIAASYVSWDQAVEFCKKLSEMESVTYRLPTEAEWEFACRAGSTSAFSFEDGGKLTDYAWFDQNAYKDGEQYAHAAGQKKPNAFGLYDMHGNVWEWCSDWHGSYSDENTKNEDSALIDPTGPEQGWQHAWRGGSFAENSSNLRSACRNSYGRVDYRPEFMAGFRVLREVDGAR